MEYLDKLPIWAFFTGMVIVVLAASEIGFHIGIRLQDRGPEPGDSPAILLFAIVFSSVLMIMVDLDRPQEGMLTISQTAMADVLRRIEPLSQ